MTNLSQLSIQDYENFNKQRLAQGERENAEKINTTQRQHASQLNEARRSDLAKQANISPALRDLKNLSRPLSSAKMAFSLAKQIQITDILFIFALILAILKDISDIFLVGSIWGVGTVISFLCSIVGGLYMWLLGQSANYKKSKGFFNGNMQRMMVLLTGTSIESFFMGVNFLPVQAITFFLMYLMILQERANGEQENQAV